MPASLSIKELHATTGDLVRRIGASRKPVLVTDRGEPAAVLSNPSLLKPRRRQRILLPEYQALMAKSPGNDLVQDLNSVRDDR